VPLHGAFEEAKRARPEIEWAPDGVHPSSSGHMLIALTWLDATGLL
jgi:acyl-CoA thioesterase I